MTPRARQLEQPEKPNPPRWKFGAGPNPTVLLPDPPPLHAPPEAIAASEHAVAMWDQVGQASRGVKAAERDLQQAQGADRMSDAHCLALDRPLNESRHVAPAAVLALQAAKRRHEAAILAFSDATREFLNRCWDSLAEWQASQTDAIDSRRARCRELIGELASEVDALGMEQATEGALRAIREVKLWQINFGRPFGEDPRQRARDTAFAEAQRHARQHGSKGQVDRELNSLLAALRLLVDPVQRQKVLLK